MAHLIKLFYENALVELPIDPPGKGQIWIIFSLFYDGSSLYIEGGD